VLEWARQVSGYGVRCILPTSRATDGARTGFELPLIRIPELKQYLQKDGLNLSSPSRS
jgi:hypothetical protein